MPHLDISDRHSLCGLQPQRAGRLLMSLCQRQIIKLRKKYAAQGEMGRVHGNRDRHPPHRIVIGIWLAKGESTSNDVVAWPACGYL